jgi:hypothetical protein
VYQSEISSEIGKKLANCKISTSLRMKKARMNKMQVKTKMTVFFHIRGIILIE